MIINRKIMRTMLERKSQYVGSLVLIIISCLLYTMLNQLSSNMGALTSSFIKDNVQEDANFTTSNRINNVQELESKFNILLEEGGYFDYTYSEGKTLRIFSQNTKVNIPAIIEGKNLEEHGIIIDPAYAGANKLKVGDEIQIFDVPFRVQGYMSMPNYIYPLKSENDLVSDPNSFGIAVISKNDFDAANRGNRFYSIKFNHDNGNIGTQASKLRDFLRNNNINISQWTDIDENKRVTFVTTKIQGINQMSSSMPVAILLLTCILTGIVMWRLLKSESVVIGTLYAQGYRRAEIKRHYLMYPLSVALTGGITGTILGALLLKPMLDLMLKYFNIPLTSIAFNPVHTVISILMPIFFLGISANFVLDRELRSSPVELMRGGRVKNKVGFIERRLTLDKLKFTTKFKVREQLRSLSRLTFLLLGVTLATMLLLLGFTAKSSMDYLLKDNLRDTFRFEYEYAYNSIHQEQPPAGTEAFFPSTFMLKSDEKTAFRIVGIEPDSKYISLKDKAGVALSTDRTIITKPLAEKLKAGPGDTIQLINKLDAREYSVTIEEVAETYIGEYVFMPRAQFNEMLGFPSGSYIGLWSREKLSIPENLLYSVTSIEESIKAFNTSLQPLQATIGVIAFVSFIIGLIVIYVVTSLIIEENRANISLMKIFGYRKKEVGSLILNSSSLVIVAGYILGIPLIIASMSMMFRSLTESLDMTLPVTIRYTYILAGFAVVYLTYELSKAMSRKKINKISMSEALKSGME